MKKLLLVIVSISLMLGGCATGSKNIAADSISPLLYRGYTCDQLNIEIMRNNTQLRRLCKEQDGAAFSDTVSMTVGMIFFWPALLALAVTDDQESEIAELKGEHEALMQALSMKDCSVKATVSSL